MLLLLGHGSFVPSHPTVACVAMPFTGRQMRCEQVPTRLEFALCETPTLYHVADFRQSQNVGTGAISIAKQARMKAVWLVWRSW